MTHRHVLRAAVAGLALVAILGVCARAVHAQQGEVARAGGGVAKLTAATRQDAVECGNAGASCAIDPYHVCPLQGDRYSVRLITPFSRVASAALEARNNRQPLGRMGPGAVNGWGVALAVYPAERSRAAEGIVRVEIHRDGTIIEPRGTIVGPVTTTMADGTTKPLSRGFFVFPVETFSPTADLAVVFVGEFDETTCTIDRQTLSTLH